MNGGYWYVKDMKSRNGVKVNHTRVSEKLLEPGDEIAIARHHYIINYSPMELGAVGPPPVENMPNDIMSKSLLERAGLTHRPLPKPKRKPTMTDRKRGALSSDDIEMGKNDPNRPV